MKFQMLISFVSTLMFLVVQPFVFISKSYSAELKAILATETVASTEPIINNLKKQSLLYSKKTVNKAEMYQTEAYQDDLPFDSILTKAEVSTYPPKVHSPLSFTDVGLEKVPTCKNLPQAKYLKVRGVEKQPQIDNLLKSQPCFEDDILDAKVVDKVADEGVSPVQQGDVVVALKDGRIFKCPQEGLRSDCKFIGQINVIGLSHAKISPYGTKVGFAAPGIFGYLDLVTKESFEEDGVMGRFMDLTWRERSDIEVDQAKSLEGDEEEGLLVSAAEGGIYFYRPKLSDERRRIEKYSGHSSPPSALVFLPHGQVFISGDWQGTLAGTELYEEGSLSTFEYEKDLIRGRFFQKKNVRALASKPGTESISSMAVSPDGEFVVTGGVNGAVELIRVKGFSKEWSKTPTSGEIVQVVIDRTNKFVMTLSRDGTLRVWTIEQGEAVMGIEGKYELRLLKELKRSGLVKILKKFDSGNAVLGISTNHCITKFEYEK